MRGKYAKISSEDKTNMIKLQRQGKMSKRQIAKKFNINYKTAIAILKNAEVYKQEIYKRRSKFDKYQAIQEELLKRLVELVKVRNDKLIKILENTFQKERKFKQFCTSLMKHTNFISLKQNPGFNLDKARAWKNNVLIGVLEQLQNCYECLLKTKVENDIGQEQQISIVPTPQTHSISQSTNLINSPALQILGQVKHEEGGTDSTLPPIILAIPTRSIDQIIFPSLPMINNQKNENLNNNDNFCNSNNQQNQSFSAFIKKNSFLYQFWPISQNQLKMLFPEQR